MATLPQAAPVTPYADYRSRSSGSWSRLGVYIPVKNYVNGLLKNGKQIASYTASPGGITHPHTINKPASIAVVSSIHPQIGRDIARIGVAMKHGWNGSDYSERKPG